MCFFHLFLSLLCVCSPLTTHSFPRTCHTRILPTSDPLFLRFLCTEPPAEPAPPAPQPLPLTKRERKKLRTQRRLAAEKEKQDQIRCGLMPPPPPKVKISNLMQAMQKRAKNEQKQALFFGTYGRNGVATYGKKGLLGLFGVFFKTILFWTYGRSGVATYGEKGLFGFFLVLSKKNIICLDIWEKRGRHKCEKRAVGDFLCVFVLLSNLVQAMKDEAVADPSQLEAKVRAEMEQRVRNHQLRNEARKLTPQQRKDKKRRKLLNDPTGGGTPVTLYRIESLPDKQKLYKIDINAQQNHLSGVMILTEAHTPLTPRPSPPLIPP